ncbi:MAG TPA: S53 family peptidase [Chloroflexia bacterium]|nr:S53 family peptidase [Chloroflexia bacterium]
MSMLLVGLAGAALPADAAQAVKSPKAETHLWYFDKDTRKAQKAAGRDPATVNPLVTGSPTGLSPSQVKSVYNFPTSLTSGTGKTIAIIDAYDSTSAENDLKSFSRTFGLPNCTSSNGCFKKVNQNGAAFPLPKADTGGWRMEISLDVQWAHAIAPGAKILLVEANSSSLDDLFAAVNYARKNADYISMSWGAAEDTWVSYYDQFLTQPAGRSVSFFASAGDGGAVAGYPSVSPFVISVGGTSLNNIGTPLFSETGWSSSGGGCSRFESQTADQAAFFTANPAQAQCGSGRATPDVSLDADPNNGGVSVVINNGWTTVGGTSLSAPMWAARSAVLGATVNSTYVYGSAITYRDITSGNNGMPAGPGFDLVTGRGSWVG